MADAQIRVLIVDDERPIRRFLTMSLAAHGYVVFEAVDGPEALASVINHRPDLVILDLGLPTLGGIEVTRQLREWTTLPIIILSVQNQEQEKIAALDAGADDYLTKPFGMGEMLARIRVALRRSVTSAGEPIFVVGKLVVDQTRRIVTMDGQEVQLTPTEFDLLRALVFHAGKVLTHHHLLRQVWGMGYDSESHMLRVNIHNLRRKLEPDPSRPVYIVTEPGVGYRLRTEIPAE